MKAIYESIFTIIDIFFFFCGFLSFIAQIHD